jgi:hypothetical protein
MGVVYALTYPDGMQYVGKAANYTIRMNEHARCVRTGKKAKEWTERYGWDQVKTEVLLTGPDDELSNGERRMIREMGTLWPAGLNCTEGGDGGCGWGLDPERDARLRAKWAATAKSENFAKARKRLQELSKLPDIEFHAKMAELRRRAEKRGMPQDKLERLYPNTFTLVQVRNLQGKSCGVPGPKAAGKLTAEQLRANKKERKRKWDEQRTSSAKNKGKRKQTSEASGSTATSVPKSRPSCASEEDHMSYLATSDDEDYGSR